MTEAEKQLLLKDLCARLPYEVKVKYVFDDGSHCPFELSTKIIQECFDKGFVPYLRPLSSMTEEEKEEYIIAWDSRKPYMPTESMDWLNAHHFDYRGLIPMGLALEAKEGMYKTE